MKEPFQSYFHVVPDMEWKGIGPMCARCKRVIKDDEWENDIVHDINEASQYHSWCWDYLGKGIRWKVAGERFEIIDPNYLYELEVADYDEGAMLDMSGDTSEEPWSNHFPGPDNWVLSKLGGNRQRSSWWHRCIQCIRDRVGKGRD